MVGMPEGLKAFIAAYPQIKKVVITADVREASSKASADLYAKLAKEMGLEVLETVEFSSRATDMSAIAIHYTVGYTSWMHLLPAFGGLGIFLLGLGLSSAYLRTDGATSCSTDWRCSPQSRIE